MYYTIYKTTNAINNNFYIGKHKSKTLTDNYLGSGKFLLTAIKKYGKQNFYKEILHYCTSETEMNELERNIVNELLISDRNCYNAKIGGDGGWTSWNKTKEAKSAREKGLTRSHSTLSKRNKDRWQGMTSDEKTQYLIALNSKDKNTKPHSYETKEKIKNKVKGNGNGMFGTHFYIKQDYIGKLPDMRQLCLSHRFVEGSQPIGWITLAKWKNLSKNTNKAAYGKHWYTDGVINYFLKENDSKIHSLSLRTGRIV